MATKVKRVRVYCANCKKINYLPKGQIDTSEEHHLCDRCDSAYISWQNAEKPNEIRVYVDDFLKSYAAKRCRSTAI